MTTRLLERKTRGLEKEVELLRSFVIGQSGKDPEGNYKPSFVKKMLRAASEKPEYRFIDSGSFLKHLKKR